MQRVGVFTGSSVGARSQYAALAHQLGVEIARQGYGLVYGGSRLGLMGVVADGALVAGGEVIGVLPSRLLGRERAHGGLTQLIEVSSMHERKARMAALADGFIALPGGFGTLDELFEITTWAQLGLHAKPIVLLDDTGYYAPLLTFVQHAIAEGFIPQGNADLLCYEQRPAEALRRLASRHALAARAARGDTPPEP